jgi:hypothetical protein
VAHFWGVCRQGCVFSEDLKLKQAPAHGNRGLEYSLYCLLYSVVNRRELTPDAFCDIEKALLPLCRRLVFRQEMRQSAEQIHSRVVLPAVPVPAGGNKKEVSARFETSFQIWELFRKNCIQILEKKGAGARNVRPVPDEPALFFCCGMGCVRKT